MSLHTPICEMLGIRYPIVLAGMGDASSPNLAAAVSNAGGLGVLGAALCDAERIWRWVNRMRELTDQPFGIDTLLPLSVRNAASRPAAGPSPAERLPEYLDFAREFMESEGLQAPKSREGSVSNLNANFFAEQMEAVIESNVAVYAAGLGDPAPYLDRLHANGTKAISVVGAVRHARKVKDSGVDIIVAQGHDAGGHNSPVGTVSLIPQVVDAAGDVPVLGAGGIVDGRGVAAALMLGAQGVWVGSAFLATHEAAILPFQKKAIVEALETGTTVTRSVTGKPARYIKSKWTEAFAESGLEALPMPYQGKVSDPVQTAAFEQERQDIAPGFAGQGIGMIQSVRPAAEVMVDLIQGAEKVLQSASRFL